MRYRGPYSIEPIADHEAGAGSSRKRPGSFHRVLSRESRPGGAISPGLGIASLRMVSEPPRVRWRRVLCPQGLGVLLVCPIGEVGPGAIALVWSRVRTSSTVLELTPSIWLAVRGPWRSARVTRGYGSSWIFELDLTCTNAFRRVQHPAFSLGSWCPGSHSRAG